MISENVCEMFVLYCAAPVASAARAARLAFLAALAAAALAFFASARAACWGRVSHSYLNKDSDKPFLLPPSCELPLPAASSLLLPAALFS